MRKDGSYVGSVHGNLDTGGGQVLGTIATGPSGKASGNAGDLQWLSSQRGIQPGHYENDLNISFPAAEVPFKGGASYPETAVSLVRTNLSYTQSQITTNVYPSPEPASGVTKSVSLFTTMIKPEDQKGAVTNTSFTSSKTIPAVGTYVGAVSERNHVPHRATGVRVAAVGGALTPGLLAFIAYARPESNRRPPD